MNRAALAIDWHENGAEPPALVWGFRWDGVAHGDDMLLAVLAADDRLFAKLGGALANPVAVYGLGYDKSGDGLFGLDDGTTFNASGIAVTGASDGGASLDPSDDYAEGWYTGFWHYGVADSNPYAGGQWRDTPRGMSVEPLVDGGWNSWTFSPTFNFAAFAVNPTAASSPFPPGDYNRDGKTDGADYLHWKDRYGTHDAAADGNRNGVVDAADYTLWRTSLRPTSAVAEVFTPRYAVPEPHLPAVLLAISLALVGMRRGRQESPGPSAVPCQALQVGF